MAGKSRLKFKGESGEPNHKRRKTTRFTPEPTLEPEPLTPPRTRKLKTDEYVFDFDDVPVPAADYDRQEEEDTFQQKLFDEMAYEEQQDSWENAHDTPAYIPPRWQRRTNPERAANGLETEQVINERGAVVNRYTFDLYAKNGMSEEEYAEHIRLGMWRRTHQEELRRQKELEKERQEKLAREKAEREKYQKQEAERIRQIEERKKAKVAAASKELREGYSAAWTKLLASQSDDQPLSYADFAWPVDPSNPKFDKPSVLQFVTGHLPDAKSKKAALRTAVLAYHPDRFEKFVVRVPEARGERARVRELGLQLSQTLNELLSEQP